LYRTDIDISDEFNNAPSGSPYSILVDTFSLVEKEGWDTARLSWLLTHGILKTSNREKDLYGSVDVQVFCFLKYAQSYSCEIECSRLQCKNRKSIFTTTQLNILLV